MLVDVEKERIMHCSAIIFAVFFTFSDASHEKINLDTLNNYSEFLNFGVKKLKTKKEYLENSIIKSKVDVLGDILKKNIEVLKNSNKLELIFLIDSSSSVGEANFKNELKFAKKLLSDVTVDYNHTRVAIVTFGSSVVTNIDQITEPKIENNKCFLLNRLLKQIHYTGGGTYTSKAFKVAKDIFRHSRNDSKKALFLITDGFSNGGNPIPLANELKKVQVTIFTIGIQNGNYKELYELASSPGEFHSYLLDSFEEFESLARRALHVDLKSGDYIPLGINSPCASLCESGDCCDKNALCTCGTTTGHYSCVCKPGFYGTGLQNSCFVCPAGQYYSGPNLCRPCPDMHHTTVPPAFGIESCTCKTGYLPTKNNRCKIVKCLKMSSPQHGYFVKKSDCGNVLNSACGIRCEVGYSLIGSSIRLCQKNATWSGEQPLCQVKTCTTLSPPAYGSMICSHSDLAVTYNETEQNLPVDTVCVFTCENGKTLIGSRQRTCLPLARWDGLKTSCKQIKCHKFPPIKNGRIEPKSCSIGKQAFGKKCKIICDPGFTIDGPEEKQCTSNHGLWDTQFEETRCIDTEPPQITCPENIIINSEDSKNFGTVLWVEPQVTDNVNLSITVWMSPQSFRLRPTFPIGVTKVTYFAQDSFSNKAKCDFLVTVVDNEPPVIEDCTSPPTYLTTDKQGANVTWDEPNFYDNSHNITVQQSHDFGFFPIGTTLITYTVTDISGNKNSCFINITVEETHCEALADPIYGQSDCHALTEGMHCVITCQEGYAVPLSQPTDLEDDVPVSFMCNHSESIWFNPEGLMSPECSVTQVPREMEQNGTINIVGDKVLCNNTKEMNDLENEIKITLQRTSCKDNCTINTDLSCKEHETNEEETNVIKRQATFEETPHKNSSKRRRRKNRVNVKFQVKGKLLNDTQRFEDINIGDYNASVYYDKPKVICPAGFVPRKYRCVQCPRGTFHNQTRDRCQSCPFSFFNDQLGQTECKSCPINYSTRKLHSKKEEDCKKKCSPGTYARKKIIRFSKRHNNVTIERSTLHPHCRSCKKGSYQPKYGQLKCLPCPKGFTTVAPRSVSLNQCLPMVQNLCQTVKDKCLGQCVPTNDFQYTCKCNDLLAGNNCKTPVGDCASNPCYNNGRCVETFSKIECICPRGYSGTFCQNAEEKCLLQCLNNGTCHYNEPDEYFCWCPSGFGGDICEIQLDYCSTNLCENDGVCVNEMNGFRCECSNGFIGKRCNLLPCDYRPCEGNSVCVNLKDPKATRNSYECVCPEGYEGRLCDEKINYCANWPCLNGGTCSNNVSSYVCSCPRFYHGQRCEMRLQSNYILNFKKFSTSDYVKLDGFEGNLTKITVCLWMQSKDHFNSGTLFSYATTNYDNAFTLTDYNGLVLYINNNHIVTDVKLNDGQWHHVCVSWNSIKGSYQLYLDAKAVNSGEGLAKNAKIEGYGNMVIGQEQDALGGRFSQSETFIGKMAYIDVWSKELSNKEVSHHMDDCSDSIFGDIYGWPDVQVHVEGNVEIENSTLCKKCEDPKPLYNGVVSIMDNVAYYDCYKGFYLNNDSYKEGRRCNKAAKWEGLIEPYCKKVYCRYPGSVRNGFTIGTKYYFQEKLIYRCHEGYMLIGNSTLICTEKGDWFPTKPYCSGLQCTAFKKPENSKLTILAEHSYEDFIENKSTFDIGTQVEIACEEKANLIGENVITCLENGTWDFKPPKCILEPVITTSTTTTTTTRKPTTTTNRKKAELSCDMKKVPAAPDNGYIVLDSLYAVGNGTGSTVEYKCRIGYKLYGENSTTCIIDGYWTEPNVTCDPIECPKPNFKYMITKNIPTDKEKYYYGNMIKFDCIDGYKIFGNGTVRCWTNGKWTKMRAKCSKQSCRRPAANEATIIEGNSYLFEDQVTLLCSSKAQYILTCSSLGEWVGDRDKSC